MQRLDFTPSTSRSVPQGDDRDDQAAEARSDP
jgi:hypothetical protein